MSKPSNGLDRRCVLFMTALLAATSSAAEDDVKVLVPKLTKARFGALEWASAGPVAGPPFILECGLTESMDTWRALFPLLATHHRVIAWNRPGIGRSGEWDERLETKSYGTALLQLYEAAQIQGEAVLVGHAAGAMMAEAFARSNPSRVAGLVCVDPMAFNQEELLAQHDRSLSLQVKAMTRLWPGAVGRELRDWDQFEAQLRGLPQYQGKVLALSPTRRSEGLPRGYFQARREVAKREFERFVSGTWVDVDADAFALDGAPEIIAREIRKWFSTALGTRS